MSSGLRVALLIVALLIMATILLVVLFMLGVIPNPFGSGSVSEQKAAAEAAEYLEKNFPEMEGASLYVNQNKNLPYWEFGYRKDVQMQSESGPETVSRVVLISVNKRTGKLHAAISD
jgi:hypothetical protein